MMASRAGTARQSSPFPPPGLAASVPGCSAGRHRPWKVTVTESTMQAYNSLRGPEGSPPDPDQFLSALNLSRVPVLMRAGDESL